jgi:hypothetical protein
MRFCLLLVLACLFQSCGSERELHVHEKDYEWLQEIEADKRGILKRQLANLAVTYAHRQGDVETVAEAVVDACAVEINEVVEAAAQVRAAERGAGLQREAEVDDYKASLHKSLRKTLWKSVIKIITDERAKKARSQDL